MRLREGAGMPAENSSQAGRSVGVSSIQLTEPGCGGRMGWRGHRDISRGEMRVLEPVASFSNQAQHWSQQRAEGEWDGGFKEKEATPESVSGLSACCGFAIRNGEQHGKYLSGASPSCSPRCSHTRELGVTKVGMLPATGQPRLDKCASHEGH